MNQQMDSGNSGSLQSSSGAEEECDSRAALLHSGFITTHLQPPAPFNHHQINNLNSHQLLNLDSINTLPSFSDHHFCPSSSQTSANTVPFTTATLPPARNPKKRSRASRKAPTTVLTTNTSNFRAMVQEFTGIPSPPFTSPTFDLFGRPNSAMMRSNTNNFDNLTQLPSYLLPLKLQQSSSSFIDSCNLLNAMQNPSNSLNQSPLLNPNSSNAFGQTRIHEGYTTLPDLISTPTTTSSRIEEQVVTENWDGGRGNYTNGN